MIARIERQQAEAIRRVSVLAMKGSEVKLEGLDNLVGILDRPRVLRIGEAPQYSMEQIRAMDKRDFRARIAVRAIYRQRRPTCRSCGKKIEHDEKVITFGISPTERNPWGRTAFIHATQCEQEEQ